MFHGFSVMYRMTTSLAKGGAGLGTPGFHERRVNEMCQEAGFRAVRRFRSKNHSTIFTKYDLRPARALTAQACEPLLNMRLVLFGLVTAAGFGFQPTPKTYDCMRAPAPIVIDGSLQDAAWTAAPWTDYFVDIEGAGKPQPRFRTRAKMLWDDKYFYVAADMEEPHVWATLTRHDSVIFHDNDFEVFIDPNGDTLEYYEFEINALNTGWDLLLDKPYRFGGKARNDWEIPGLRTAVHIRGTLNDPGDRDGGWSVEIAFPWSVLGEFAHKPAPPKAGDEWRVNFSRVEWRHEIIGGKYRKVPKTKEDNWVWSPQGVINMHVPEKWGTVRFIR
jgi:hypothetical protein